MEFHLQKWEDYLNIRKNYIGERGDPLSDGGCTCDNSSRK